MSGRQLDWELLKELECPVCTEYMSSPVNMCENGHNICGSCKERLSDCPTCRGTFINVRNITLENLAATALYPCRNIEAGCEETFTLEDRKQHLSVCVYQSRECPVSTMTDVDCSWTGTLSDIPVHIKAEHESVIPEVPGHLKLKLLDLDTEKFYIQPVLILGELFLLSWYTGSESFFFTAFHFGPKEESEAFKYGIKLGNSEEYIAVIRKCQSYLEGDLMECEPCKCVAVRYDTILDFVSETGYLSCEIEIGREKLGGFVLEDLQEHLPVVSVVGFVAD
jgi:E3 ubiquitin-protein ligase SIAH1